MFLEQHEYVILQLVDILKLIEEEVLVFIQHILDSFLRLEEFKQLKAVFFHTQSKLFRLNRLLLLDELRIQSKCYFINISNFYELHFFLTEKFFRSVVDMPTCFNVEGADDNTSRINATVDKILQSCYKCCSLTWSSTGDDFLVLMHVRSNNPQLLFTGSKRA